MKFKEYILDEAKRKFKIIGKQGHKIKMLSDFTVPETNKTFTKGSDVFVLYFNREKDAFVWAPTTKGQKKIAIPKNNYEMIK